MSQADLKAAFESASTVLLDAQKAPELAKITARWQASVATTDKGLKVTALGPDPQLVLPAFAAGKQSIAQIVIDSPVDTLLELFFKLRGQDNYSTGQFQRYSVKAGRNVVYFMIDQPNLVDPLRLDPGIAPGEYLIESIVAKEITKPANQ